MGSPERKDDQPGDDEDDSEEHKDAVTGPLPLGVIEQLCGLEGSRRKKWLNCVIGQHFT